MSILTYLYSLTGLPPTEYLMSHDCLIVRYSYATVLIFAVLFELGFILYELFKREE